MKRIPAIMLLGGFALSCGPAAAMITVGDLGAFRGPEKSCAGYLLGRLVPEGGLNRPPPATVRSRARGEMLKIIDRGKAMTVRITASGGMEITGIGIRGLGVGPWLYPQPRNRCN